MHGIAWWQDLAGIAGLVTALGGAIAAVRAARSSEATRLKLKHEMAPNSGSSLKDAVNRIEATVNQQREVIKLIDDKVDSVGHQVGEIKRDALAAHQRYDAELADIRRSRGGKVECPVKPRRDGKPRKPAKTVKPPRE